ncbi:MAG: hypothetical protein ACRD43_05305, partial [Pyrinomonadaceae bacterium]
DDGGSETAGNTEEKTAARIEPDALIAPLQAENESLRELIRLRDAREQLVGELQKAGARSPGLLFAHAADGLQFDTDGRLVNAAATVEKLRRAYPEQFGRDAAPPIDAGAGGQTGSYLTKAALSKMKPADIARLDWAEVRQVLSGQ